MYNVFIRNWYKIEDGKKVPDTNADKEYLMQYIDTEKEARQLCREYNDNNDAGILSRKAEYEDA